MTSKILLKNGTVLLHEAEPPHHVRSRKTDILIIGNIIAKVEDDIAAPEDAEIIDCTGKIISPGFIDTHHHLWQTQVKARCPDQTLLPYIIRGNMTGIFHDAEDSYIGTLAGALESIDAGTTTVVDFAHATHTPEHAPRAIDALTASGLRAFYCYCPNAYVKSWSPLTMTDILPPWVQTQLSTLAAQSPWASGRVRLGFAFDGWYLPHETIASLFEKVRSLGMSPLTSHVASGPVTGDGLIQRIDSWGLLSRDYIIAHGNGMTETEEALVQKAEASVSTTPYTELAMAIGDLPGTIMKPEFRKYASLGIDGQAFCGADLHSQMRELLCHARGRFSRKFVEQGKNPKNLNISIEEVFNMATVGGARAVGLEGKLGVIKPGALADLVVYDGRSTAMGIAAENNPVSAVVEHAGVRDVEMVLVDGVVRKRSGVLCKVEGIGGWKEVEEKVRESYWRIEKRIEDEGVDWEKAEEELMRMWHLDPKNWPESL